MHIAIHEIRGELSFERRKYSKRHRYSCDEWNMIGGSENLIFEITLDDEVYEVKSPATTFYTQGDNTFG
ncbi:hypothetical protein DIU36_03080 [Mucilaginibacter rubeus]|nr:hypothetical protein DIU36_03080 [Mucilaginibacter rubeus]